MLTLLETITWLLLLSTCLCWGTTIITNLFRSIAKAPRWWTRLVSILWPLLVLLALFAYSTIEYWNLIDEDGEWGTNNLITPHDAFWPFFAVIPAYLMLCIGFHVYDKIRWKRNPDRMPWRLGRRWVFAIFVPQCCLLLIPGMMLLIQWQARVNFQNSIDYWDAEFRAIYAHPPDPEGLKTQEMYRQLEPRLKYVEKEFADPGDLIYTFDYYNYNIESWGENYDQRLSQFEDYAKMVEFYQGLQKEIEQLDEISQRPSIAFELGPDLNRLDFSFEFRTFVQVLSDDAKVALEEKEYERVFRNALILKRISIHHSEIPGMVGHLITVAFYRMSLSLMVQLAKQSAISQSQWQIWWEIAEPQSFQHIRASSISELTLVMRSMGMEYKEGIRPVGAKVKFLPEDPWKEIPFAVFKLDRNLAYINAVPEFTNQLLKLHGLQTFDLPSYRRRVIPLTEEEADTIQAPGLLGHGAYQMVFESWATRRNETEALRLIQAAQKYAREHGQYPPDLATLVPEYIDQIPVDQLRQDHALHYELLEDGSLRIAIMYDKYQEVLQDIKDNALPEGVEPDEYDLEDAKIRQRRINWQTITIPLKP